MHDLGLQKNQISNQIQELNNLVSKSNLVAPSFNNELSSEPKKKAKDQENIQKINKQDTAKINASILGWPGRDLYGLDLNILKVREDGFSLLQAIDDSPGLPLGGLPITMEKALISSEARDLHQKRVLLLSPG